MWKKSKLNITETDFNTDIPEYDDQEILAILKKRKYYQPEAVKVAMEEALKRNLINSENDLFDEEFQVQALKFRLFPNIEDDKNKTNIRKSIARSVLIAGIIPTIWGFLKFNNGNHLEGEILIALGFAWIFLSARLIQQVNHKILNVLTVLSALSVFYVSKELFTNGEIVFMDIFIIVALYSFMFYGLFFIRRLKS